MDASVDRYPPIPELFVQWSLDVLLLVLLLLQRTTLLLMLLLLRRVFEVPVNLVR